MSNFTLIRTNLSHCVVCWSGWPFAGKAQVFSNKSNKAASNPSPICWFVLQYWRNVKYQTWADYFAESTRKQNNTNIWTSIWNFRKWIKGKCFQDKGKRKDKSLSKELTLRSNLVKARGELVKVSGGPPWVPLPRVLTGVEGAQVE